MSNINSKFKWHNLTLPALLSRVDSPLLPIRRCLDPIHGPRFPTRQKLSRPSNMYPSNPFPTIHQTSWITFFAVVVTFFCCIFINRRMTDDSLFGVRANLRIRRFLGSELDYKRCLQIRSGLLDLSMQTPWSRINFW
jgi:hypothetical protein